MKAALTALLMCLVLGSPDSAKAQASAPASEPSATRPPSDSSFKLPGRTAGTNYLHGSNSGVNPNILSSAMAIRNAVPSLVGGSNNVSRGRPVFPTSDIHTVRQLLVSSGNSTRATDRKAYTNYVILKSEAAKNKAAATPIPGLSPVLLKSYYGFESSGGKGATIIVVDAFRYPQASSDLLAFSKKFSLPECSTQNGCLAKYPQSTNGREDSKSIDINCGWATEAAMDIEWAHAFAPQAKIVLIQAKSDSFKDLFDAIDLATKLARKSAPALVSLSWGGEEFNDESQFDSHFPEGALYFAASGDTGGTLLYPAASPLVISVGGTGLAVSGTAQPVTEYGWTGSGGGESRFETAPLIQKSFPGITGTNRNIPDISADADPESGASVLITTPRSSCKDKPSEEQYSTGWSKIGGTSLATPIIAAMTASTAHKRVSVSDELNAIYRNAHDPNRIRDITVITGTAGGNITKPGYDNVTGVGSPAGRDFDANPIP